MWYTGLNIKKYNPLDVPNASIQTSAGDSVVTSLRNPFLNQMKIQNICTYA